MAKKKTEQLVLTRKVSDFNPVDYLETGTQIETNEFGQEITKKVKYLPAWARQLWFNLYVEETKKVMSLTTELQKFSNNMIIQKATLTEVLFPGTENQMTFPVATGQASAYQDSDPSALARCETIAKARCLGSAGFSIREEQMFDEGEKPVDGPLIDRRSAVKADSDVTGDAKPKTSRKKKTNKPKEEEVQEVPAIDEAQPEHLFPPVVEDDESEPDTTDVILSDDEKHLEKCLMANFPYGSFRGQNVIDVIDNPGFITFVKKMKGRDYKNNLVSDDLTLNELIATLCRYLDDPTPDDRATILDTIKRMRSI